MPTAMRDSNRSASAGRGHTLASIVLVGLLAAACGGSAPTPTPAPAVVSTPAPSPTPDVHLASPTTLEDIFKGLQVAGLDMVANNAGAGHGGEPIRTLNATYDGWPLVLSQYSSAKALAKAKKWKAGKAPGQGEPPLAIKGLNILVEWGPTTGRRPPKPDPAQSTSLTKLVAALDPLLFPLKVRANVPVELPEHTAP
jgi:hypothetical protein